MLTTFITVMLCIFLASLYEWLLHRFVMHRPFFGFSYPFERHALIHHKIFKADHTYHLQREKDKYTIPMAWWNGVALASIATLPAIGIGLWLGKWLSIPITAFIVTFAYYGVYERIHWCMHLPKPERRVIERQRIYRWLNGHHLLHHRYQKKNFNVVLPLWDLLLGTLIRRSLRPFCQATGLSKLPCWSR